MSYRPIGEPRVPVCIWPSCWVVVKGLYCPIHREAHLARERKRHAEDFERLKDRAEKKRLAKLKPATEGK